MKDIRKFFSRNYRAVSTREECSGGQNVGDKQQKSLNASRTISQGFSIVDSFFSKRSAGKRTRNPKSSFLLMAGGLFAIAAAILIKIVHPYELIFRWKLIFGEGGEIFGLWEKPPIDLYIKIYLFNITNAEEFLAGNEKMKVEEVGPYVYKEVFQHQDVVFNDNETLSTRPKHPLIWQEHMSEGRQENDTVMMLNIAMLSIAQVAANKNYFVRVPINLMIRQTNSQPIVKMTAREFMFGYKSTITTLGNTLLPNWIYFDKVGLIDRMYDFDSDFETFYTGQSNPSLSGLYDTYMGSRNLPQWDGEHCSNIQLASDGTKFKSFIEPNDTVLFFRKSMCRPQRMIRSGDESEIQGFNAYKYVFEENALDNGYYNEKNKCYCRKNYCQPRGLIDVTDCYYGFPISLSYPHFMDGDPKLFEKVDGLKPNRSHHESYFMVQPRSGLPLTCSVKFQINMHFRDVRSMTRVERFSHSTIPMLWFEITMLELPENLKNRFTLYLKILPYIDSIGFWGGLVIGAFCLIMAVTRVTMTLPFLSKKKSSCGGNSNEKGIYAKVNVRSGIYMPCELKLIEMNEKNILNSTIPRHNNNNSTYNNEKEQIMYEIDLKSEDNFILEREPAVSDDESNDSDTNSRQSTDYSPPDQKQDHQEDSKIEKNAKTENSESKVNQNGDVPKFGWVLGEASSLIDDIGNDRFPSLRINEDDLQEIYINEASEM